jgi:DNA processing protein
MEYVQDTENLMADLFVSELLMNGHLGGRRIRQFLEHKVIRSLRDLYRLPVDDTAYAKQNPLAEDERRLLAKALKDIRIRDTVKRKAEQCLEMGVFSVNREDADYPTSMKSLDGMPLVLYGMGDITILSTRKMPCVAVVGSRMPTLYGVSATREITADLTRHGICIISGLARGVDTIAHETALVEKGKTVAVLAGGLDQVYPPENKSLFERIRRKGLVLSEMPLGQQALRQYFPARNRILSGLSDVVAIMEAGEFSGTLHTASFAAAQGRDVFVLPGTIYAQQSRGNLHLIRDGADILLSAEDILTRLGGLIFMREMDEIRSNEERINLARRLLESPDLLSHEECLQVILDHLSLSEKNMDELCAGTGFSFHKLAPIVSELELSGKIMERRRRYALTFLCT